MERDMNVTMILAQFELEQKQMILSNAGQHAYPLLYVVPQSSQYKLNGSPTQVLNDGMLWFKEKGVYR